MSKQECCGFDCNQGRACPLRERRAAPPTGREWLFVAILLALGVAVSFVPYVCDNEVVDLIRSK